MNRPRHPARQDARSPAPPGLAARTAATRLVGGVLDQGRMLEEADSAGRMAPAERAEAERLADLTLRRLGQIDDLLSRFAERQPSAPACHILRVMTAELVFGGTAAHAAVDMAVRQAKGSKRAARLSGLINAVGRRIAADGAALATGQDAAELNTAPWLAERLVADWGAETARAVAEAHLVPAPHDLTVKVPADADALARELDGRVVPNGSVRLEGRPQLTALPGFREGAWWAQDAAAAMPAAMLGPVEGQRVLDLCAAPGGKTMQLAAAGAKVTALDASAGRMERLRANLERTGLAADLVVADALKWQPEERFDAILLDAPCSATGTIRRHPDLPWRSDGGEVVTLMTLQRQLLERAIGWLVPGGTLIYAVCSLLKTEGEDQVDGFLAEHPAVRLDPAAGDFATAQGYLRTRPDHWAELGGLDGFFAARLIAA